MARERVTSPENATLLRKRDLWSFITFTVTIHSRGFQVFNTDWLGWKYLRPKYTILYKSKSKDRLRCPCWESRSKVGERRIPGDGRTPYEEDLGGPHMKVTGILVVSLRSKNLQILVSLRVFRTQSWILLPVQVSLRAVRKGIYTVKPS